MRRWDGKGNREERGVAVGGEDQEEKDGKKKKAREQGRGEMK